MLSNHIPKCLPILVHLSRTSLKLVVSAVLDFNNIFSSDYHEIYKRFVKQSDYIHMTSQTKYKYRNGLWPMQYVFLIRSSAGGKKLYVISDVFLTAGERAYQKHVLHGPQTVSIFIANLHAIFNDILRKNMGLSLLRT